MKRTTQNPTGTSFHGTTFLATVKELKKILGLPVFEENTGEDKVNFEWEMETDDGDVFTVYDWKEYRKLKQNETISWHIGGNNYDITEKALEEIEEAFNKLT